MKNTELLKKNAHSILLSIILLTNIVTLYFAIDANNMAEIAIENTDDAYREAEEAKHASRECVSEISSKTNKLIDLSIALH